MKIRYWIGGVALTALTLGYLMGPKVPTPTYDRKRPKLPPTLKGIARMVKEREQAAPIRKNNAAHVRFYADVQQRTEYAILYLHGFGGSWYDGYPVNCQLADHLSANIYLARWGDHGLQRPYSIVRFTADLAWEEAKEALEITKALGQKVIILSTSTGGTLALKLAAEFPTDIHALINLSPNVKDRVPGAWVLNSPWGAEVAALIGMGDGLREITHEEPGADQYFDTAYVSSALVHLQNLVATTMTEATFNKITCPVLTLYYYKNPFQQDKHVDVRVYDWMYASLGGPAHQHKLKALATPGTHFLGCELKSRDTRVVLHEAIQFVEGLA